MRCRSVTANVCRVFCAGPVSTGASGERISQARSVRRSARTALSTAGSGAFQTPVPLPSRRRGCAFFASSSAPSSNEWAPSVELYAAIPEDLPPTGLLLAHERVELLRRAGGGADAGLLELLGDDGIGIHLHHLALHLVDDGARRAGRRHEADPGGNIVERGDPGLHPQRP